MNQNVLLSLIVILAVGIPVFLTSLQKVNPSMIENYTNLGTSPVPTHNYKQKYPFSQTDVLLEDSFPLTGRSGVSNDQGSKIWWHYPIFEVGSYDQITNNLKFSNNPDTGRCMPADVCGSLYKEYQTQNNYVFPQPPVKPKCGTRVNYSYTNTASFLPYRAKTANILY